MDPDEVEMLYNYVYYGEGDHLDIGTNLGGSAIIAWTACSGRPEPGVVVTIDISSSLMAVKNFYKQPNSSVIERILANSHTYDFGDRKFGTVFVDGDHTYEGCKQDLELAVRLGAKTIIVHDMDLEPVIRAVEEFDWPVVDQVNKIVVLKDRAPIRS
jgi:predicted O-methyltransferase YrrM